MLVSIIRMPGFVKDYFCYIFQSFPTGNPVSTLAELSNPMAKTSNWGDQIMAEECQRHGILHEAIGFDTSRVDGTEFRKCMQLRCFCIRDVCNPIPGFHYQL
jgi:hypothetical protein